MAFVTKRGVRISSTLILDLLLFLIVLIGCLKAADVLVGWQLGIRSGGATNRHLRLKEHAPNLSIKAEPGKAYLAGRQGLAERSVTFRTDKDGFILGPTESAGNVDVVFIGGSTTECLYVEEKNRFPYLVSQLLRRGDDSASRTLNAGVSANHSMHSTLVVLGKVLPYKPRAVVVMHNANDLALLVNTGSYWIAPPGRSILIQDNLSLRSLAVSAKDLLIPNIWSILGGYLAEIAGEQVGDEFAAFRGAAVDRQAIAGDFRSSLTALVHILRAWNIVPVLMTQFNRVDLNDDFIRAQYEKKTGNKLSWNEYVAIYKQFNDVVREVAKDTGAHLIDLDRLVPHSSTVLYDQFHLNDEGSKLVADTVARELAQTLKGYKARTGGKAS